MEELNESANIYRNEIKKSETKHNKWICTVIFGFFVVAGIRDAWIELSVPPIWIYIPLDAQMSPPTFGIFKSVC